MGRSIAVVAAAAAGAWIGIVAPGPIAVARGDVITQWTFNSGPGPDNDPTTGTLSPETGAGTLTRVGGVSDSGFAQGASADTSPTATGNNNSSFETQGYPPFDSGNKTAGIQIAVNTSGYQDITFSYQHNQFGNASARFRIQYSTDGVSFTDGADYTTTTATTFFARGQDFSAIPGLDDNPNAKFRIVAEFQSDTNYFGVSSDYSQSGRNRFDLVTVSGTPVPEPTVAAGATLALAGWTLRRRRP
jgi:hypothetical protein